MREGSDLVVAARSFEDFYLKDYQAVVGLAYALSGNRWLAEDLAQEAFLAAHRNWPRISAYDQPGAWVRRVVANLSVSAFRRRMVEAKTLVRLGQGEFPVISTCCPICRVDGQQFHFSVAAQCSSSVYAGGLAALSKVA